MTPDRAVLRFSGTTSKCKVSKIRVQEGCNLTPSQCVILYEPLIEDENIQKRKWPCRFKTTECGIVAEVYVNPGDIIGYGSPILEYNKCNHPVVLKDICAGCGTILQEMETQNPLNAAVSMIHTVPALKISPEEANTLGKVDEEQLLKNRKLVLMVDLDQTLIHTTNNQIPPNIEDVFHFQLQEGGSHWYHTRLRPFTRQFLESISSLYEMHICTFGTRSYAHTIARELDKNGNYFSNRIVSRDECISSHSKTENLKALFPCGDHMVVIIDDRADVWNFAHNLIQVRAYNFFQHTGDINAPPGLTAAAKRANDDKQGFNFTSFKNKTTTSDKFEEEACEGTSKSASEPPKIHVNDPDDYLLHLENILRTVHQAFYKMYGNRLKNADSKPIPADTRVVLPKVLGKVLKNVRLVFSGLIPTNTKQETSRPYLVAKSLGAVVEDKVTESTTHVVAARPGTSKHLEARNFEHVHVVTPDWLWTCAERWERVDERLYPLPFNTATFRQKDKHNLLEAKYPMGENGEKLSRKRKREGTDHLRMDYVNEPRDLENRPLDSKFRCEEDIPIIDDDEVEDAELTSAGEALEREFLSLAD